MIVHSLTQSLTVKSEVSKLQTVPDSQSSAYDAAAIHTVSRLIQWVLFGWPIFRISWALGPPKVGGHSSWNVNVIAPLVKFWKVY